MEQLLLFNLKKACDKYKLCLSLGYDTCNVGLIYLNSLKLASDKPQQILVFLGNANELIKDF